MKTQTAYIQESEGYAIARGWASIQEALFPHSSIPEFNNAQWVEACNNLFAL